MKRRTFVLGATTAVVAGSSIVAVREIQRQKSANFDRIDDSRAGQQYDVCIIGSGPAGCTVAEQFVARGKRVVMLESGVSLQDMLGMRAARKLDVYGNSGSIDYPLDTSRIRALGGTSNIWTGRCPRLQPDDFAGNPLAPAGGWPLSYADIAPYYQRAEEKLYVSGDQLSASQAPRQAPLPYFKPGNIDELRKLFDPLDIAIDAPPVSRTPENGSPLRYTEKILPHLAQQPNMDLFSDATATRLESDGGGSVTAVEVRSNSGETTRIEAQQYIVACGALESTRLLLLSGIGNHADHLGRYFMEHPFVSYRGLLPGGNEFPAWQMGRTYQFSRDFNEKGHGGIILGIYGNKPNRLKIALGIEMSPERSNRITLSENKDAFGSPGLDLHFAFSERDNACMAAGEQLVNDIFTRLGASGVQKLDGMHWSHHHIGSTRMSARPEDGVVDENLRVHGSDNLYVASSSTFVTSGAANPTLTIVALSLRLSDHLLGAT